MADWGTTIYSLYFISSTGKEVKNADLGSFYGPPIGKGSHLGSVILAIEEKMSKATGKEIRPRAGREYFYFRIRGNEKETDTV